MQERGLLAEEESHNISELARNPENQEEVASKFVQVIQSWMKEDQQENVRELGSILAEMECRTHQTLRGKKLFATPKTPPEIVDPTP